MMGKTEGRRRRGRQRIRWLDSITDLITHEFEQAQGVGDRQGGLACCSPWGRKELDATEYWVFFGRNDAKAETPVLWPPHAKS